MNVAEISQYGDGKNFAEHYGSNGGLDIDSKQNNVFYDDNVNKPGIHNIDDYKAKLEEYTGSIGSYTKYQLDQHMGLDDDQDFEQVQVGKFDLSLRKFISSIESNGVVIEPEERVPSFTADSYNNWNDNGTATYYHKKSPITVRKGDKVTYTIRIYNEGHIEGYANEITDYLPAGLKLAENSSINGDKWKSTTDSTTGITKVTTNQLKGIKIQPVEKTALTSKNTNGFWKAYKGTLQKTDYFWQEVQIECEVVDEAHYNKTLTNVAEISNYSYKYVEYDSKENPKLVDKNANSGTKGTVDIDSEYGDTNVKNLLQDKLTTLGKTPTGTITTDYYTYQSKINKINTANNFTGLEDDDDFENIKIVPFDLALRKFITSVESNGSKTEPTNRVPTIKAYSVTQLRNNGTAIYYHEKTPITVKTGDYINYTIRIYNEGTTKGIVKEVTDYLPKGLKLVNGYSNNDYSYSSNTNTDGSSTITITPKAGQKEVNAGGTSIYANYVKGDQPNEFWIDIPIQCEVTSNINGTVLTNVAEITNYGYIDNDGNYQQAEKNTSVDSDSQGGNVFEVEDGVSNIDEYRNSQGIESVDKLYFTRHARR